MDGETEDAGGTGEGAHDGSNDTQDNGTQNDHTDDEHAQDDDRHGDPPARFT